MNKLNSKKLINAWCLYDWANSAYNLVITSTIFPAYYEAVTRNPENGNTVRFLGRDFVNTALYNYALGFAFIVVSILSPILTSIADTRGNKKNFMRFFCTIGSIACATLYFFAPIETSQGTITLSSQSLHLGIICMVISCIGFWASLVFYNSYLPILFRNPSATASAPAALHGVTLAVYCCRSSVLLSYSSLKCLVSQHHMKKITCRQEYHLYWLPYGGSASLRFHSEYYRQAILDTVRNKTNVFKAGFLELKKVWQQVKHLPVLKRFLYSFFWYSAGIQTVFLAATQFGAKELHLPTDKLIITIMIIQLVAIPGAIIISRLSEKFGNFKTLIGVVTIWVGLCAGGYFITTDVQFYILGAVVGLVMGGIQSLSRSTYANLMPETKDTASFFSFFDVTEKIALVLGMFSFAYVEELTGSMRNSVLALMVFFFFGLVFLIWTYRTHKKSHQ